MGPLIHLQNQPLARTRSCLARAGPAQTATLCPVVEDPVSYYRLLPGVLLDLPSPLEESCGLATFLSLHRPTATVNSQLPFFQA